MSSYIQIIGNLFCGLFLLISSQATAQNAYVPFGDQELLVEGTSTIHDWEMVSSQINGEISVSVQNNKINSIDPFKITMPVQSLKSGKSAMDKNAYEALNADKYQQIIFEFSEATSITDRLIRANCMITISGTTNKIALEINYNVTGDSIEFEGSFPITFSQFHIDPPKAMLGTIKTGDKLKISFKSIFKTAN